MRESVSEIIEAYGRKFGGDHPVVVTAPGRVNLIGEHTDYNDGFVLPVAIDRSALICGEKTGESMLRLHSTMYDQTVEYPLEGFERDSEHGWANYILGVVRELQNMGHNPPGANIVNSCTIPLGSGLSSSAALEVAVSTFFQEVAELDIPAEEVAKLCQRAENEFVGVKCGIMDQFISRLAERGTALFIDCRSLEYQHIPFNNPEIKILICNTGVKRGLVDSEYNTRRTECEQGTAFFARKLGRNTKALRDVTTEQLQCYKSQLPENVRKRCRHVISENQRVIDAKELLRNGDYEAFGELLYDSHVSLRDDYEVSCRELDIMVEILKEQDGVLGARMTGAGFGGCAVSIFSLKDDISQDFIMEGIGRKYAEATGITSDIFFSSAESGVSVVH